ncbi:MULTISPECIES: outer membrane lipid asymmetry maintenance protein MlaD [unclassified Shewanella]|jgi:phospholipid/cholesterol/gamma-HCH transport system substrate-binding protein|uniref:outer membrane lipid asymmetry maintenance protein MlaD n=1 Tax=unclassified Shewanella TaxID=196818 RepID=UPI000C34C5E1|nr:MULTISPECIES: outer membrane lipid asymmetry maintenance protein MlaD [unclassified Shewanella]MBB1361750.1 outer membrane lipid asymmetry maintenance protein MlaD [Shewanella sp. SR44-4]MBO1897295.1 outer membrane lipid asymmetry maintenance protein MlaD [Shewanella sp. BF02_Schw]PKH34463.1 outer membrane lipid asymmetry maintenance protein MlaD [Shewanella sp. ALD9]QHS15074.1 outer membrane lipid asymmetry maintenance protein MlaD [Shewanella sp. Arc9-LZ]
MKNNYVNFLVGLFVLFGIGALVFMSITIGGASVTNSGNYTLVAKFENSSGLKEGAFVEMSGVRVGLIQSINYDPKAYESVVKISLDNAITVPDDSIASIRTSGIIGDRFVKISTGGSEINMADGEEFIETESSISIEELISKYMFSQDK